MALNRKTSYNSWGLRSCYSYRKRPLRTRDYLRAPLILQSKNSQLFECRKEIANYMMMLQKICFLKHKVFNYLVYLFIALKTMAKPYSIQNQGERRFVRKSYVTYLRRVPQRQGYVPSPPPQVIQLALIFGFEQFDFWQMYGYCFTSTF